MMGHTWPYYGAQIEAQGYEKAQDVLAYELKREMFALPDTVQRLLQSQAGRMKLRQVDRKKTPQELELLRNIFNDAWSKNWPDSPDGCAPEIQEYAPGPGPGLPDDPGLLRAGNAKECGNG